MNKRAKWLLKEIAKEDTQMLALTIKHDKVMELIKTKEIERVENLHRKRNPPSKLAIRLDREEAERGAAIAKARWPQLAASKAMREQAAPKTIRALDLESRGIPPARAAQLHSEMTSKGKAAITQQEAQDHLRHQQSSQSLAGPRSIIEGSMLDHLRHQQGRVQAWKVRSQ